MRVTRRSRIIWTTAVLAALPFATAIAQTRQAPTPAWTEIKFAAPAVTAALVGLTAKSSDGMNLGTVYGATIEPGGKITSIGVRVGDFLGFGAHMVILPEGSFYRANDTLQVNMTRDEVDRLPKAAQE